jgi:hypothetical protein
MKKLITLTATLLVIHVLAFGQTFPQLEPHLAKYTQDRKTLDDARARQVETLRARYVVALTGARADAVKANKGGAVAAIDAEIQNIKSEVQAAEMPADLPRSLATPRRDFIAGLGAAEKACAARLQQLNAPYVQILNSLERAALNQNDAPLVAAIRSEKARIDAMESSTAAIPKLRQNVVVNGDFTVIGPDKLPEGWEPRGAGYQKDSVPWQNDALVITEGSEKFVRFRRMSSVRLANIAPKTPIQIPPRAKVAVVTVRLRVEGLVAGKNYDRFPGVTISALDAAGKSPGNASASATENTRWRNFTASLTLQPGAKTLEVSVGPWAATGICDFDDVVVKFE